jgi:hypothetical protein
VCSVKVVPWWWDYKAAGGRERRSQEPGGGGRRGTKGVDKVGGGPGRARGVHRAARFSARAVALTV